MRNEQSAYGLESNVFRQINRIMRRNISLNKHNHE